MCQLYQPQSLFPKTPCRYERLLSAGERILYKIRAQEVYHLRRLEHLCWWKLGLEDPVPEAAGDSEAVLVVCKVVLEVVLLQLAPVGWKTAMIVSDVQKSRNAM